MFFCYILPGIMWALLILILSILPGKDLPEINIINIDKAAHLFFYAVLSFLLLRGFVKQYHFVFLRKHPAWIVLLSSVLYGILIECIQGAYIADRYFDLWDALANTLGVLAGVGIFKTGLADLF